MDLLLSLGWIAELVDDISQAPVRLRRVWHHASHTTQSMAVDKHARSTSGLVVVVETGFGIFIRQRIVTGNVNVVTQSDDLRLGIRLFDSFQPDVSGHTGSTSATSKQLNQNDMLVSIFWRGRNGRINEAQQLLVVGFSEKLVHPFGTAVLFLPESRQAFGRKNLLHGVARPELLQHSLLHGQRRQRRITLQGFVLAPVQPRVVCQQRGKHRFVRSLLQKLFGKPPSLDSIRFFLRAE